MTGLVSPSSAVRGPFWRGLQSSRVAQVSVFCTTFSCAALGEVFNDPAAGGQVQAQAHEQFGHASFGAGHAAQAQLGELLAAAHGEHHVHAFDGGHFLDEAAGAGAEAFAVHPHLQGAPHRQREEAHSRAAAEAARQTAAGSPQGA